MIPVGKIIMMNENANTHPEHPQHPATQGLPINRLSKNT
jgi:hypothetical protein